MINYDLLNAIILLLEKFESETESAKPDITEFTQWLVKDCASLEQQLVATPPQDEASESAQFLASLLDLKYAVQLLNLSQCAKEDLDSTSSDGDSSEVNQ